MQIINVRFLKGALPPLDPPFLWVVVGGFAPDHNPLFSIYINKGEVFMNVYILTDLEGITGINSIDQMERTEAPYQQTARRALTGELNRAGEICRACGAENIWYIDGHGGGGTVLEDEVLPFLQKTGISEWVDLLRAGKIDCQLELGAHARAGTIGGFLDHTLSSREFFSLCVNGREFSELALHAALCGVYDVPIVFCSGDETACAQAKEYVPQIVTAAVKVGTTRNECVDYPDAAARLEAGIREALARWREIPPMKTPLPAEITLTFYRTDMCEQVLAKRGPEVERLDARTLRKISEKITTYQDLKI